MRSYLVLVVGLGLTSLTACEDQKPSVVDAQARCEQHGVPQPVCARCNPKLEPAFRAQNDWCQEHSRPESQCVLCNPELAKAGVKP